MLRAGSTSVAIERVADLACRAVVLKLVLVLSSTAAQAQRGDPWSGEEAPGSYVWLEGGGTVNEDTVRTARETGSHSTGTPEWKNPAGFEKDVFTFTRVVFKSGISRGNGWGRGRRLGWWIDYPDADLNFSFRLQQLTSTRVDPDGRVVRLADADLHDYPLLFLEHPGYMELREDEVVTLRNYFAAGGALFVADFWSTLEWDGFAAQMKRVLPERGWTDLGLDHPIFHCVFNLRGPMKALQVPTIQFWNRRHDPNDPASPLQINRGEGSQDMHVRALLDDRGRIMIIAIHNCDLPDGWEREGENDVYFHTFSEKISYPLGINVIFYLMTH